LPFIGRALVGESLVDQDGAFSHTEVCHSKPPGSIIS
jgi:hypothetical protein